MFIIVKIRLRVTGLFTCSLLDYSSLVWKEKKKDPDCSGYARLEYMENFSSASHSQRCDRKVIVESNWVTHTVWVNLWSPWRAANAEVPNKTSSWSSSQNLYVQGGTNVLCLLQDRLLLVWLSTPKAQSLFAAVGQGLSWKGQEMTPGQGSLHHGLCSKLVPWHVSTCGICQVNKGCSWNGFLDQVCVLLNA